MKASIKKPRGTRDFSPGEMEKRTHTEKIISGIFENYNYKKILFPTFEHAELFEKKSGEEIQGHMYVFRDKSDRRLCLRPEATASVCRMFSEELRGIPQPLKLYYSCPMFRYERPQKGRYREFWQMGVELIGPVSPESDSEIIEIAIRSLANLGLDFELEIGHLGILRGLLIDLGISEEIQNRIIAVIDKGETEQLKELADKETLALLSGIIEFTEKQNPGENETVLECVESMLNEHETNSNTNNSKDNYSKNDSKDNSSKNNSKTKFKNSISAIKELKEILSCLDVLKIDYKINPGIARGLEYYTGMVFEIRVPELGAQSQICGGGRYDDLIGLFSGVKTPAVGFAFGFDRVLDAMDSQGIKIPIERTDIVVAPVNKDVRKDAMRIASELREKLGTVGPETGKSGSGARKFRIDFDLMNRKLGKILEYASDINSRYAIIVGPAELKAGEVILRDMKSGEQSRVKIDKIAESVNPGS